MVHTSTRTKPAATTVRHRRRFPVRPGQVAVWQLAVVATVLTDPTRWQGMVVGGAGLVAVGLTALPWRGRWLYQWAGTAIAFRARRTPPAPAGDPLDAVLPGLRVHTVADRAGNRTGVAGDGRWWSAVLRVGHGTDPLALLDPLRKTYDRADLPPAAVQLVTWTVPVPDSDPVRTTWLAVRFSPTACPAAVEARGGGVQGALSATANCALGLARDLAEAGIDATVLDAPDLRDDLTVALGATPDTPARVVERWRHQEIGTGRQSTYRPSTRVSPRELLTAATPGTAAFTTTSLTLTRPDTATTPDLRLLLRIATPPAQIGATPDTPARVVHLPLYRLDGTHAPATTTTLPLALP
ncbi:hypothetical protein GCM10022220_72650 [Actinocatenispora rupis]